MDQHMASTLKIKSTLLIGIRAVRETYQSFQHKNEITMWALGLCFWNGLDNHRKGILSPEKNHYTPSRKVILQYMDPDFIHLFKKKKKVIIKPIAIIHLRRKGRGVSFFHFSFFPCQWIIMALLPSSSVLYPLVLNTAGVVPKNEISCIT